MPIYEYVCTKCGTKFDALRSFKDADSSINCKTCGSDDTQRALSVCYAHGVGNSSQSPAYSSAGGGGGGCGGCSGGSCGSCHH